MFGQFENIMEQTDWGTEAPVFVLACSGGIDSMVMLHLFQRYCAERAPRLVVAHINHRLRDSANADEEFVREYADEHGLEFISRSADVPEIVEETDQSIEMAARSARYRLLESIREEKTGTAICTAHTKSDQAETVLMRLIHGTGVHGAQGIRRWRDNVFRPLLDFIREDIEHYASEHGVPFREDPSNADQSIERNWVRHALLPLITGEMNPNVTESLAHFSRVQSEVAEYLDYQAEKALKTLILQELKHEIILDIRGFREYFSAVQKNILLRCFARLTTAPHTVSYARMRQVLDILLNGESGQIMTLPGEIYLVRDRNQVLFTDRPWQHPFAENFRAETDISLGNYHIHTQITKNVTKNELSSSNEWNAYFDAEFISEKDLVWRTWENGDIMKLRNCGTKKLSDIWIDTKTPLWEKHQLPLLAEDTNILWIPGVKRSGIGWITGKTEDCVKIVVGKIQ